jgi:OPA family sugar phosphate sensor protein UhpC-like MFS transporter
MGCGLFATGLLNVLFAFGDSLPLLLVVWTLNGFFRAGAGPLCSPAHPLVFPQRTRLLVGMLEYVHQYWRCRYPADSAFAAHWWGWQAAMLTPGIISMALGVWLTLQLRGTPQEEGLPSVGEWRHDPLELRQEQQSPPMGCGRCYVPRC